MTKDIKPKKQKKVIVELTNSIGWVSFTPFQMKQIGINPKIHGTSDLRKKVLSALNFDVTVVKKSKEKK